ncbi:hypothetical protein SAMN05421780_11067 [Flexibacter flexilis DSM 6793]|uniref:Uncharacterized protein n=1 Tax=Flexibacter flexilis DSM 6793 TaxID=927664 RepID=A0A1I1M7U7_9BACT|nr:hypothetical protein [Flexibacter flexilis]SFC81414.1 hypothetical protein SAMN05421780_11067 [Flexibacter flexilis DSM 6793]
MLILPKTSTLLLIVIALLSLLIGFVFRSEQLSQQAYKKGVNDGITCALDTVNKIVAKQLKFGKNSTKLVIQSTDTSVYILSNKTLKTHK